MSESLWKFIRENQLKIASEVSKELKCNICNELMIKACNASCGCRFCSDCIENYLNGNDRFCPGTSRHCQKRMINYANDIAIDWPINIRISEIVVNCPTESCEFKDEVDKIESHVRTCNKRPISCPFNKIGCEMNEVRNEEMKFHLDEENYCHSKLLIDMINNLRNEMESIKSEIISLKNNNIELNNANIDLKRKNSQSKQQIENIKLQLTHQQQKVYEEAKEQEKNREEIRELSEKITAVKIENRSLRNEMIEFKTENIQFKQQFNEIETIQTKSQHQIDELRETYKQEQWQENYKDEMEKCFIEIRSIQTKIENTEFINFGILDWQIDKLSNLKRNELIYSKPFFSGPSGYKMCLAVNISSDYYDDYIYIYFYLMHGESDNKLEWPFKYVVTTDAIDPSNGFVYRSESVKYSDSPDYAGWKKPSNDRNDPIIYDYYYSFINLSAVKNDKLLLKCRINKL